MSYHQNRGVDYLSNGWKYLIEKCLLLVLVKNVQSECVLGRISRSFTPYGVLLISSPNILDTS